VAAGARRAGAPPAEEGRRFQPHLTLARCRAPVDARSLVAGLSGYTGTPWTAQEIYLIRSHLPGRHDGPAGDGQPAQPRHEALASWPLHARAVPAAPEQ
jgi:RNA 2',3'-cyclic 3'-phosphodiesterase